MHNILLVHKSLADHYILVGFFKRNINNFVIRNHPPVMDIIHIIIIWSDSEPAGTTAVAINNYDNVRRPPATGPRSTVATQVYLNRPIL